MKRTLILPVVLVTLAILAFATAADAEPCAAQNIDIVQAKSVLAYAKKDADAAKSTVDTHRRLDHFILNDTSGGPICHTCVTNLYSWNQARASVTAAEKALAAAEGAYETCLGSYVCGRCNQLGDDHLASTQPNCSHRYVVYTCDSDANTHNQLVCSGCNQTYWQCGSDASNHVQVTCSSGRMLVSNALTGWRQISVSYSGCGKTYWKCKDSASHRVDVNRRGKVCMLPSSSSGGGTGGGGTDDDDDDDDDSSSGSSSSGSSSSGSSSANYDDSRWSTSSYRANGRTWSEWRNRDRTCSRCGTTFNARNNGTCNSRWGTRYRYHSD